MRIAITGFFRGSAFSGALPQVAVNLSRVLVGLGHEVEFIIPMDSDDWFIDCKEPALMCPRVKLQNGLSLKSYNLLIEVVWFLPPELRIQLAAKTVMFYHYPPVFYDIEGSVYPVSTMKRSFVNVDALWTWSHFKKTDVEYLELLSRRPVFTLPFFWDPVFCNTYSAEAGIVGRASGPAEVVICESNESNTSNCTLPLTILSEIFKADPSVKWTVINGSQLLAREFFVNNVLKNLYIYSDGADISGNFAKRVRLPDLLGRPSVVISHQRWRPLKYMLLDALWLGLPLIHNCTLLKDISGAVFYPLNQIKPAVEGWNKVCSSGGIGLASKEALLERWGPLVGSAAMVGLLEKTLAWKQPVKTDFRIAFFDMWVDFQPDTNLFVGALKASGLAFEVNQKNPSLIFFGPFGDEHKKDIWKGVKKVFFTGECLEPRSDDSIILNVGFKRSVSETYFRLPIWMTELNWFNQDTKNPMPFDLTLLKTHVSTVRGKFCIFVTSNPNSVERNTVFQTVSRYKKVDSAGRLFSNMEVVAGGPGGAGGQQKKLDLYRDYKFAIVCENKASEGYVTEKLLHAKLAGCIPIYWGDPAVNLEFNSEAFINVCDYKSVDELLNRISSIDKNDQLFLEIANRPLIKDESKFRAMLTEFVAVLERAFFGKGHGGVVSYEEFNAFLKNDNEYKFAPINNASDEVVISCCDSKFVNSAVNLIKSSPLPVYFWTINCSEEEKRLLKNAGAKEVYSFDLTWFPNGWNGFWNMEHYAWKPLLLKLANTYFKQNTKVIYVDAGVEIVCSLKAVLEALDDIFLCEMSNHKMRTWCHPTFCAALKLTDAELDSPQISANIIGFKVGGKFKGMFDLAFELAQNKEIISGNKWHQYSKDCLGHRHDQSIFSLLRIRAGLRANSLEQFSDFTSRSKCVDQGLPFYVHRGSWNAIDEILLVNLDHRQDRLLKFNLNHGFLQNRVKRVSAVYGKTLTLDTQLINLFRTNNFNWKKGVIGCALSHYNIWKEICIEKKKNVLVLEDDVVLDTQFLSKWSEISGLMPADADIVFLGGVLPPNKALLPHFTEPVNSAFARIKQRGYFHFCTYSYIITLSGAQKLIALIKEKGIFTSIDHMIVNHGNELLNIYFTTPLLAGCFQDADPKYVNADFNDFNRIDKFDSEIWNNNECFSPHANVIKFIYFEQEQTNCIESDWMTELFGPFEWVSSTTVVEPGLFILYYQHTTPVSVIEGWVNRHTDCKLFLFHASDEACNSDISLYKHASIRGVFRNYWRPECSGAKVLHLPLGYLNGLAEDGLAKDGLAKDGLSKDGLTKDGPSSRRQYDWSFAGAMDRPNRLNALELLKGSGLKYYLHQTQTWQSPENIPSAEYKKILQDTKIVPCLEGFFNVESYRFYEALEQGCIPIFPLDEKNSYANIFTGSVNPPLLGVKELVAWPHVIKTLVHKPDTLDKLQTDTRIWWTDFKLYIRKLISEKLSGDYK